MLIYLIKKEFPWDNILENFNYSNYSNYFKLLYLKETNALGNLFENIPQELIEFIKYTRNLKFEQDPDYSYLRSLFNKIVFNSNSINKELTFSWINSKNKELSAFPRNTSKKNLVLVQDY